MSAISYVRPTCSQGSWSATSWTSLRLEKWMHVRSPRVQAPHRKCMFSSQEWSNCIWLHVYQQRMHFLWGKERSDLHTGVRLLPYLVGGLLLPVIVFWQTLRPVRDDLDADFSDFSGAYRDLEDTHIFFRYQDSKVGCSLISQIRFRSVFFRIEHAHG